MILLLALLILRRCRHAFAHSAATRYAAARHYAAAAFDAADVSITLSFSLCYAVLCRCFRHYYAALCCRHAIADFAHFAFDSH